MECYQYKIRKEKEQTEVLDFNANDVDLNNCEIKLIDKETASKIILDYEWLHSIPTSNKYYFGIYFNINDKSYLGGALIFGNDYSENTNSWERIGFENKMLLLSRGVCLWWTPKNTASYFISRACKWIKNNTNYKIITATVDPAAGEIGTIYQALNWKFGGLMRGSYNTNENSPRFNVIINGVLRYPRWIKKELGTMKRSEILKVYPDAIFIPQYRKYRYFYFIGNKKENKIHYENIKYLIQPYIKRGYEIIGIIYKITNKFNGKIYIGQTTRSLNNRYHEYEKDTQNEHLKRAFNLYGFGNFQFEIIDRAQTIDELNEKEINYIKQFNSTDQNIGYNIEFGGGNSIPSEETLIKLSKAHKGTKQSDKWIAKRIPKVGSLEAKKYGRPKSEEDKKYLSENSPKFWLGKKRDPETIRKMSETKKKKGFSDKQKEANCKRVYKVNYSTNELICTYESTSAAGKGEGVSAATISRKCQVDKVCNGILWTYNYKE